MLDGVKRIQMTTFIARPAANSSDTGRLAGAYMEAYVDEPSEPVAVAVAQSEVTEAGWEIESVETAQTLAREDFDDGDPGLEYYEQALVDKCLFVFHTWPAQLESGSEEFRH